MYAYLKKWEASNKQPNFIPQGTRKEENQSPKLEVSEIKIREEISEIETKKII